MKSENPEGGRFWRRLTWWRLVAAVILVAGLYATFIRFSQGLGASTNLSDEFPWGIWIGFDVLVGVGLAAGGFVVAATVHIFNLEKYHSIGRPTILTAFLGYLLVIMALMFDLGRPYRIWHPLIMWNPHSVMFEVAWCVTLYTTVLALEFSPVVLEKFNLKVPLKWVEALYVPIVIAGVLLSTLHQSSLGTLYVIVPDKLYGLWYTPLLPVFFFISAIAAGLSMTIIESFLSLRAFGRHLEKDLLDGLARALVVILAFYLVFKGLDLSRRGQLDLLFTIDRRSVLFWGEIGLGAILPMGLLLNHRLRSRESVLFFSALLVVIGFIINRLNVAVTGMLHSELYVPKWSEIVVTLSVVVLGFVFFGYAVRKFRVFPEGGSLPREHRSPVFTGNIVMAMWGLLLLFLVAYALSGKYEKPSPKGTEMGAIVRAADPLKETTPALPADIAYATGENEPGKVIFSHRKHIAFQPRPDCSACHSALFPILGGAASLVPPPKEAMHGEKRCGACHNGRQAFAVESGCPRCHGSR